jgi:hypothetical protein
MSPARDSIRTPSGARTSSDRVGDSNLHQQTCDDRVCNRRHSYLSGKTAGLLVRYSVRVQVWIHNWNLATLFQQHRLHRPMCNCVGNDQEG